MDKRTARLRPLPRSASAQPPWWGALTSGHLLDLRDRLLRDLQSRFGAELKDELEDVVHAAFVVLFQRKHEVEPQDDGVYRYLQRVAGNRALDVVRVARRRGGLLAEDRPRIKELDGRAGPDCPPEEENERIWQIYCALGELDRLLIWRYVVDEESVRAISSDLHMNWHAVAAAIDRVLRTFAKAVEP